MSDKIERLNPKAVNNTPEIVVGKLHDLARQGVLFKLLAIAIVEVEDNRYAEVMIGSSNIDRYDLLSAAQQAQQSADAMYRLLVEAGHAASQGPLN